LSHRGTPMDTDHGAACPLIRADPRLSVANRSCQP
jgi:hypothetical protein